jgi:hypothetical protein
VSEAINLTPTSDVDTPRTPVETPVPPLDAPISITKADLSKMLQDAVAAGRADPNAGQTGPAVYPEVVEVWTKNELIRRILGRITWFSERD